MKLYEKISFCIALIGLTIIFLVILSCLPSIFMILYKVFIILSIKIKLIFVGLILFILGMSFVK